MQKLRDRLPKLRPTIDTGEVYVLKRGDAYKIGFSRSDVDRRARANQGELLFTIPTGQQPGQLECIINHRFAAKRMRGGKRAWFALDTSDLEWLQGLAHFMADTVSYLPDKIKANRIANKGVDHD